MGQKRTITMDDLAENQREIAEIIGLDNYLKLTQRYGGDSPYIHKIERAAKQIRDETILEEFERLDIRQLALKHGLSVRTIYNIIPRRLRDQKKRRPLDGQIKFF